MNTPPLIELNEVFVTYRSGARRVPAVQGVSLRLNAGERVGLVGESGSGKSTLARVVLGLERPESGNVSFAGQPIWGASRLDRPSFCRQVQLVFQDPYGSLNPRLPIGRALEEVLAVHRVVPRADRTARVHELLGRVGLDPAAASRYPHEFSGGQRQRIALARALAVEPRVLVADEPVSALDVSVQVQMLNLLADLQRRAGLALLLIAHDLSVVRYSCDRVYVMYQGRVVEEGPVDIVLDRPRHPYTERLLAAVPDLDLALAKTELHP
jgi:ABC-type glutathione transport system ATPase component